MYMLIWIIFVLLILILVGISEYNIAKQDEEWMKRIVEGDRRWTKETKEEVRKWKRRTTKN